MELSDERHGHAVEAVAGTEAVDQAELGAQQLRAAADARDDAGDDEAEEDEPLHREAVEFGGRHVEAHGPKLEAHGGVEQEVVDQKADDHRDHEGAGAPQAKELGELHFVRHGHGLGDAALPKPVGIDDAHEEGRHVVEHDGDDHLVLPPVHLEEPRHRCPEAARDAARHDAEDYAGKARDTALSGHVAADDGAHEELALAAQVEHAAPVGEAGAEAGEDEGRGPGKGGAHAPLAAESPLPQGLQGRPGIGLQGRHDDATHQEGQQHRDERNQDAEESVFVHSVAPLTFLPWPGRFGRWAAWTR